MTTAHFLTARTAVVRLDSTFLDLRVSESTGVRRIKMVRLIARREDDWKLQEGLM
jgi:hypothetical protein